MGFGVRDSVHIDTAVGNSGSWRSLQMFYPLPTSLICAIPISSLIFSPRIELMILIHWPLSANAFLPFPFLSFFHHLKSDIQVHVTAYVMTHCIAKLFDSLQILKNLRYVNRHSYKSYECILNVMPSVVKKRNYLVDYYMWHLRVPSSWNREDFVVGCDTLHSTACLPTFRRNPPSGISYQFNEDGTRNFCPKTGGKRLFRETGVGMVK